MRNYIILNGKNSNEINGLLIQELPSISKPQIRTETEEIDGRDGDIVTKLGFAAYDKEISVGLYKDFDINEIIAYFNSEGTIVFSNEPDKYYNYQIIDQIDFERLVRYRTATIRMHCQPFKYSNTQGTITKDASDTVSDEGSNLVLENTAEAPFKRLDPKGNSTQQTYSGKNIFNKSDLVASGSTLTMTDNGWRQVTTSSGYGSKIQISGLTGSTAYTLSWKFTRTSGATGAKVRIFKGTGTSQAYADSGTLSQGNGSVTFTTDSDATQANIWFYNNIPGEGDTTWEFVQLEKSATATAYEPYVSSIPSPNPEFPQAIKTVTGLQTVKITGKNLFDTALLGSGNIQGINFDATSDGLSISGTESYYYPTWLIYGNGEIKKSNWWATVSDINTSKGQFLGSAPYTVSARITGGETALEKMRLFVGYMDGSLGQQTFPIGSTSVSINATKPINFVAFGVGNNVTYDHTIQIQCELGSQASDYEPYQAQSQELNLGKNLFDLSSTQAGYVESSGTFNPATANGERRSDFLKVDPNTEYTFEIFATSGTAQNWIGIGEYASNSTSAFVRRDVESSGRAYLTITTSATTEYVVVSARNLTTATEVQFSAGGRTSYSPYKTPIELAKIGTYQDYIWNDGGTWKIHKAVKKAVLDGSSDEWWTVYSIDASELRYSFYTTFSDKWYGSSTTTNLLCDTYTVRQSNGSTATDADKYTCRGTTYNGVVYFMTPRDAISGSTTQEVVASFREFLADNVTTLYYPLATPVDEEITDATLIEQLEALAEAHSYKGRTHINATATGNNAPHIIAAEVGVDNESIVTNSGNINSKPVIKIYGSGNIGAYLNDIQILQIALGDEGYITIDTNLMEAYKDTLDNLKNRLVTGDYSKFSLKPGANKIHFSGTVTKYEISKYSRWL